MSQQERYTDHLVISLLEKVGIKVYTKGNSIKEFSEAFTHASKNDTEHRGQPDLTAVVGNFALVFEDKADTKQQAKYIAFDKKDLLMDATSIKNYAENGALHYALKIVQHTHFKNVIAFGCSGTEEGRLVIRPIFVSPAGYTILPRLTSFEPIKDIDKYYREVILGKDSLETVELRKVLDKSSTLHEALRNYGQLGVTEKPLIVSALLLALQDEQFTTEQLKGLQDDQTDGKILFEAIKRHIDKADIQPEEKKETVLNQFRVLVYRPFLSQFNDKLGKTPLKYFAEYLYSNVLNAIYNNHPEDVLGRFYGEFMRYGGGDGQNLGIVLTPRHITELFVDLLDIQPSDKVLDPCCGTGGFLIAAMTKMLNKTQDETTKRNIKLNQLHGIEIRDDMFAIATTNMILRGDGKSNLKCEDFLKKDVQELRDQHFTVGLMNPPYSQGKNKDTKHLSELQFICHLLDGLADNAKCAVIVPQSVMTGNNKNDQQDKQYIYDHHTIEGVVTLNTQTFYPVGTNPVLIVFTAHQPHPADKLVKFVDFRDDGYEVIPHIGLLTQSEQKAEAQKKLLLDCWQQGKQAPESFIIRTTIQPEDEWLHSFYYFNETIPTDDMFEKTIADYLTFQCNMMAHGRDYLFEDGKEDNDA